MVNGKTLPQNAQQHNDTRVVKFRREHKNSANWCAKHGSENSLKMPNLILFPLYLLLKLTYFLVNGLSDNLDKTIAKL